MTKLYDCGIVNFWWGSNFGAILTCYALQETLKENGLSSLVIRYLPSNRRKSYIGSMSDQFAQKYLEVSPSCECYDDLKNLNHICQKFIVGSDQVWRYKYFWKCGATVYMLDFVDAQHKKIAYAASFGNDKFEAPEKDFRVIKSLVKRFDNISVREHNGVSMVQKLFGMNAEHVLDPVFLADKKCYERLLENSDCNQKNFIAFYILDKTKETEQLIKLAEKKYEGCGIIDMIKDKKIENWLYYIKNCHCLITDSFHGVCFAIIFNKPFVCLANKDRGYERFKSLLEMFGLMDNCLLSSENLSQSVFKSINYKQVNSVIEKYKEKSLSWLLSALYEPKSSFVPTPQDYDDLIDAFIYQKEEDDKELQKITKKTKDYILGIKRFPILKREYLKMKILSKITFGNRRNEYKKLRKTLKRKIKFWKNLEKTL